MILSTDVSRHVTCVMSDDVEEAHHQTLSTKFFSARTDRFSKKMSILYRNLDFCINFVQVKCPSCS